MLQYFSIHEWEILYNIFSLTGVVYIKCTHLKTQKKHRTVTWIVGGA